MTCLCLQTEDPLGEAVKFLKPLQLLAPDRIETHLLAYEIYSRKGEALCHLSQLEPVTVVTV